MKQEEIVSVLLAILNTIDETNSNIEMGYDWKQSFLKDLSISGKAKKELGYYKNEDD